MNSVVVGAGLAGLSAALELARAGRRVTVLEAAATAGGRAQAWSSNGFRFDLGPTLLVMTGVLRRTLGDEAFAALNMTRLEPGYDVRWPGGERLSVHSDIAQMLDEVARFEPGNASGFLRLLAQVYDAHVRARRSVLEVDHTYASFARMMLSRERPPAWVLGPLRRYVERFVHHPRLVEALTFHSLYLGTSPLRAPAMYALLPVEEIVGGVWSCAGGTGAVVDALLARCTALGVTFAFETAVEAVRRRADGRLAIHAGRQQLLADDAVIAMDRQPSLALFNGAITRGREPRYGHSAFLWYLGVAGRVPLAHHSVLLPDDPWAEYARLDAGDVPYEPLVYVANSAVSDASCAPPGSSALLLLAPVPNRKQLPDFDEDALRERVLRRVEALTGPLRERIVVERRRGPREFERELNLMYGAAFGPDHTLDQMGPFRPAIAHPSLPNVAFAGSGTRPGSGIPMVLISGRLAAERLLR